MYSVMKWSTEGCFNLSKWDKLDMAYDALRTHMEQISDKDLQFTHMWVEDAQGNPVKEN